MLKLSIIIPVYNVEQYLRQCIESIINQTLKDIEIICVDDCSTDNSFNVLEEYAKKDERIKIIKHDINKGLGSARNTGIKFSKGEYIGFIDSDDYISLDYFENLYNTAKKYNSDITSTLNIKLYDMNSNKINNSYYNFKKKEYKSDWNLKYIENIFSYNAIAPYVWNKIYRRSFLIDKKIEFMDIKFGCEDANFTIKYMAHKPKISFNNKSIIYYRQRKNSLTDIVKINKESVLSAIIHMTDALKYYEENFIDILYDIYYHLWIPVFNFYSNSSEISKRELYNDIVIFANKLQIRAKDIDTRFMYNNNYYNSYLALISSKDYNDYLYRFHSLNKIEYLDNKLSQMNNYVKIFAISNSMYYFDIIIFGIKISFKKIRYIT